MAAAVNPRDVFEAALFVLQATTGDKKVALTYEYCELFEKGELPVYSESRAAEDVPLVPDEPAKPTDVELVDPRKVKSTQLWSSIHAIAHAERYAIDLSWDIVLRFGCRPETWQLPLGESAASLADVPKKDGRPALMPHDFFVDWLTVAKEEAKHYSKWCGRLTALGKPYGSSAGHDGLWESATKTAQNLAARLAVVHCVHEARGLDTYLSSRERFVRANDKDAIDIIDANHIEEIGHVRRGKKWLEWLCENQPTAESDGAVDAKALYRQLVKTYFCGPLRPPFNEASREKAGLTREWWGPLVVEPAAAGGAKGDAAPEEE
jgi:uncharacterized ferritin-like protein (DUF455 family)